MPKLKQKALQTKKLNTKTKKTAFKPRSPLRRRLLAGAVIAVVLAPASWYAVYAQTSDDITAGSAVQQASKLAGRAGVSTDREPTAKEGNGSYSKSKTGQRSKKDTKPQPAPPSAPAPAPAPQPAAPPSTPAPPPVATAFGQHDNITTTIFWIGEAADASNAHISNAESAWDVKWQQHFGGFDDPDHRNGYYPVGFTPLENPFYFALPYNDLDDAGNRKPTASNCPKVTAGAVSWCKNAWIKVTKNGKTAYAQWQDVGPLQEDDAAYVFGSAQPKNTWGAKAGLDVSPAVRDFLGLGDVSTVSWSFVSASAVPAGPWKNVVTNSPGGW